MTGIILEIEDRLEFGGVFRALRQESEYTDEQLSWILEEAKKRHLQVIPLVQCLNHLDFLLKHREFARLREHPDRYSDICPSHPDTLPVIMAYIRQVLDKFPSSKFLHLGADGVGAIGHCPECRLRLLESSRELLYAEYMTKLIRKLCKRYSLEIMIWDNRLRNMSKDLIKSLVNGLVQPCVWYYQDSEEEAEKLMGISNQYLQTIRECGGKIWAASAYKGVEGPDEILTPVLKRLKNQAFWLKKAQQNCFFEGLVLVGWSRHGLEQRLCVPLPMTVHSLILCLSVRG